MKLMIMTDLHLICPEDEFRKTHRIREHFSYSERTLHGIRQVVATKKPDLIVITGDVIDWYTDANRDFAVHFFDSLNIPWHLTPGNHDIATYEDDAGGLTGPLTTPEIHRNSREGWAIGGIDIGNRIIEAGSHRLILMDSADKYIPIKTQRWLESVIPACREETQDRGGKTILFTHIPFNVDAIKEHIIQVNPERNAERSVQQGTPNPYTFIIQCGLDAIFTGHFHQLPGYVEANGTAMHLLPISSIATGRTYPRQGTVTILEPNKSINPRFLSIA